MRDFKRILSVFLVLAFSLLLLGATGLTNKVAATTTTGTIIFGTASGSVSVEEASVTGDDDKGNAWTVTTVGTSAFNPSTGYNQIGSSKSPATSITFTTTLASSTSILSMSCKFGGFSGTAGTVTMKVGDTTIGTGSLSASTDVTINSTGSASDKVLTVTVTGISKGVKAYYISYTYTSEAPKAAESVTMSEKSKTINLENGSFKLTATVQPKLTSDTAVWSSSDSSVATVEDGTVTLLKVGTTRITCTYGSVSDYCDVTVQSLNSFVDGLSSNVQTMNWETYFKASTKTQGITTASYTTNDGTHAGAFGNYTTKNVMISSSSSLQLRKDSSTFISFDYNYSTAIQAIMISVKGTSTPKVVAGKDCSNYTATISREASKVGDYYLFDLSADDYYSFKIEGITADTVYIYEIKVYLREYTEEFESNETLASLALVYTQTGEDTYDVESMKLRFGTNNQITKALYDELKKLDANLKFGVELSVAGGASKDHVMTNVAFVDKDGNAVEVANAAYVNFAAVVPVTQASNYDKVITAKVYVSINGVKYYMSSKSFSVNTICKEYVDNDAKYGIDSDTWAALAVIGNAL